MHPKVIEAVICTKPTTPQERVRLVILALAEHIDDVSCEKALDVYYGTPDWRDPPGTEVWDMRSAIIAALKHAAGEE